MSPAIAPGRTPADFVSFNNVYVVSALRQVKCRSDAGESGANHADVSLLIALQWCEVGFLIGSCSVIRTGVRHRSHKCLLGRQLESQTAFYYHSHVLHNLLIFKRVATHRNQIAHTTRFHGAHFGYTDVVSSNRRG